MRRLFTGFAVVAITALVPVLALAGNQEVAERIARGLRSSGQMSDYKIGVTYQDGTAVLHGRVTSEEQMNTAIRLALQTADVKRVVNELNVENAKAREKEASQNPPTAAAKKHSSESTAKSSANPLRTRMAASLTQKFQRTQPSAAPRGKNSEVAASSSAAAAHVDRVMETEPSAAVNRVSAEEPQQLAMPVSPEAGVPMPQNHRGTNRMAMYQQNAYSQAAPSGAPLPMYTAAASHAGPAPARYDQPCLPNYAWPSYAAYPNYAAVTYPKQYSPTAWPYIGPFYPYPQVPLGWRKVTLEWDSGWWFLDFKDQPASCWHR